LTEAPRYWWLRIRKDLLDTGWLEIPFLPATFLQYDDNGLCGVCVLHVDDGMLAGKGPRYEKSLRYLQARAPLDKWRRGDFEFTGRRVKQNKDFSIEVDQHGYWKKVDPVFIPRARRSQPEDPLTHDEFVALRSLVGKLSWPARESCPTLAWDVSYLQQSMGLDSEGRQKAQVQHLVFANKALAKAKTNASKGERLHFKAVKVDDLCVLTMSDASHANMPRLGSQGGFISILCQTLVATQWSPASILEWGSSRIKRVVKSTLASESASFAAAQDRNEFARVAVAYFFGLVRADRKHDWTELLERVPGYLCVDAKSLYDLLNKCGSLPAEKRVALDLVAAREGLEREVDKVFWIPSRWMLADSFTKEMKSHEALELLLRQGGYSLQQEVLEQAAAHG